jgi:hypothetical protein
MHHSIKLIVLGFAMMILGGSLIIADAASEVDTPNYLVYLSLSLFIGFILIIIGLCSSPKNPKE